MADIARLRSEVQVDLTGTLRRFSQLEARQKQVQTQAAATAAGVARTGEEVKRLEVKASRLLSGVKTIGRTLIRTGVVIGATSFLPTIFDASSTVGAVSSFIGSVASSAAIGGPLVGLITGIGGTASLAVSLIRSEIAARSRAEDEIRKRLVQVEKENREARKALDELFKQAHTDRVKILQQVKEDFLEQRYRLAAGLR